MTGSSKVVHLHLMNKYLCQYFSYCPYDTHDLVQGIRDFTYVIQVELRITRSTW